MEVIFSASAFRHGYAEQNFYELLATNMQRSEASADLTVSMSYSEEI
jgi:hypothetical protein